MTQAFKFLFVFVAVLAMSAPVWAQPAPAETADEEETADVAAATADETAATDDVTETAPAEQTPAETSETPAPTGGSSAVSDAAKKIDDVFGQVEQSEQAREVSSGVLAPIYALAERFSFPAFHWLAFAVMVTGVVSFAFQLVLGKLVVLSRMGFSATEILSDALGLVVSVIGLVLTTQAATENSTFTSSPLAVLSATAVGALLGFMFYLWGQRQELQAVAGRRAQAVKTKSTDKPART